MYFGVFATLQRGQWQWQIIGVTVCVQWHNGN